MKKPKIQFVTLSPEYEDGHRKTLKVVTLATCCDRGTAELILSKIKDNYKVLTDIDEKDSRKYILSIGY